MKIRLFFLAVVLFALQLTAQTFTDIYTVRQDPSLIGKRVVVVGIVTVPTGVFDPRETIIADPEGSAWSGIIVWDEDAQFCAQAGNKVRVIGKVAEREGMTEIQLESATLIKGSYELPERVQLETGDIASGSPVVESFESVIVQVNNVRIIDRNFAQGVWVIDDGSGSCRVSSASNYLFYNVPENGTLLKSISGVVRYRSGEYLLEPRYRSDIRDQEEILACNIYAVQQDISLIGKIVTINGVVSAATGIFDSRKTYIADPHGGPWSGVLVWDSSATFRANTGDELKVTGKVFEVDGMTTVMLESAEILGENQAHVPVERVTTGDISTNSPRAEIYEGVLVQITGAFVSDPGEANGEWLVDDGSGNCRIGRDADSLYYEVPPAGTPIDSITGIVNYSEGNYKLEPRSAADIHWGNAVPIGDTLTIIQRPIQNIPAIVVPGDSMQIQCEAPQNTTGWKVELIRPYQSIALKIKSAEYDLVGGWWTILVEIPDVSVTGLYDLKVSANGLPEDISKHAVSVIREYKDEYYFIHITDPHLPTHYFLRDGIPDSDSSSIIDFREVIKDINIINPEFVLLTGDLVNEGELEEYLNMRYFTKAQRLLTEFEVPFYLTSGNHDLGGWNTTPPPDGTARRTWWKFFGWKRLNNPPPSEPLYTQNYSFDYGPVHFIGLEAYLNYDGWRYGIYDSSSFTERQIQWLKDDLKAASKSKSQVVFYHYDFNGQLDLDELGVEMALWGHTHQDSGDLEVGPPYNISTAAVCDGKRAFRLIRVSNGDLRPSPTISAGWNGENLTVEYQPANDGTHDSVTAIIRNANNERFEHAMLRFNIPKSNNIITVSGGELVQVDSTGPTSICYVHVDIPPKSELSVTVGLFSKPYVKECSVNKTYLRPGFDTLRVLSEVVNPYSENIQVEALILGAEQNFCDTLQMFDDGEHADKKAGDNIYGAWWPVPKGERYYQITIRILTLDSELLSESKNAAQFCTVGPVIYENMTIEQKRGNRYRMRLKLRNSGSDASALNVKAEIIVHDPSIKIEDNYRDFGDIAAGGTARCYSFYTFIIPEPPDSVIKLDLKIFSNDILYWQDSFEFNFSETGLFESNRGIPAGFTLKQNYPNPFNSRTTIEYGLARQSDVQLTVYDLKGTIVTQWLFEQQNAGYHIIEWNASDLSSGIYFYQLKAGKFEQVKKCLLIK